ncbi:MAG: cell division protein ZapA [Lachnospiraceae bacterium]|nr:cell division protein ZapA [Candidatus Colinaster equi]
MAIKTDTEVIIGGKVFTLCGYESEEYLQRIASYINSKLAEYSHVEGFRRANMEMQNVLMQINIADDYFKAKNQISAMEEDLATKEKELYDLKHELVNNQMKMENLDKKLKSLKDDLNDREKKIIELEAENKNLKK